MTFHEENNQVTLRMTRDDYALLLVVAGFGMGEIAGKNRDLFWALVRFMNDLNAGNPDWRPVEDPDDSESRRQAARRALSEELRKLERL